MGIYLNPNNNGFQRALNSKIYVDKTELIDYTNEVINTEQQYICVSRPRRFGKTMALEMLSAYYSRNNYSKEMFKGLKIERNRNFEKNLNKYNVLFLNMYDFLTEAESAEEMISYLQKEVIEDLKEEYPDIVNQNETVLSKVLNLIYKSTKIGFVILIDEWDCIFRVNKNNTDAQARYLDFLRNLLKDKQYVSLAYMTGILPVKKYGIHSALNMFDEFSMSEPKELAEYVGFTEEEVKNLCNKYEMNFEETKRWYNGYIFNNVGNIYNPKSVVSAMRYREYHSYWTSTETYEALRFYIDMNFDGLKDSIIKMLAGENVKVNVRSFQNDMTTFQTKDDVMTLLIHLGYLAYKAETKEVFIPNEEIREEYITAIQVSNWQEVRL